MMNTVVVDAAMKEKLVSGHGSVVVRDEAGAALGEFRRFEFPDGYELLDPPLSDVEIAASLVDPRLYSAQEVEEQLRRLGRGSFDGRESR